ncbi:MAG: DEAD/DEAH box helicase family protein [Desulfovibrio sp.]|jgi:type III restriction enzyme|nr:DEAD/DEAH box helicase family protein [Desulfovibrio sp.]
MPAFMPKRYQQDALDALTAFFHACQIQTARRAFALTTDELYGKPLGYSPLPGFPDDMPYFCLRIPTGGGKTWLAAKSVNLVNLHLLRSEYSVILWLTPTEQIRVQTLDGLKDRDHPLHAALREAGAITVLDLNEAKSVTRATLDTSTTVIVVTRQAFQVENENRRKVYESNGALQHHFDGLAPAAFADLIHDVDEQGNDTIPCSLVNVLRLRRPFVIVDEAHNSRTSLSFETLAKFRPSGILELTATPDMRKTPSNVLFSVSAAELKAEEMIKLPIVLQTVPDWRQCLADAIDRRNLLQAVADKEWTPGMKRLRPIVLIQAEAKSAERETVDTGVIKGELMTNNRIPQEEIVVATGEEKGLESLTSKYPLGLNDPACPARYVITQKALAEGWDCPSAYILVSVASLHSSTAVEQLLGRILRQPEARRRASEELNQSYAFVASRSFTDTAAALTDQLVTVAGFEKKDAREFVVADTPTQTSLFDGELFTPHAPVKVSLPQDTIFRGIPASLKGKVEWDNSANTLTIKSPLSAGEMEAAKGMVAGGQAQEIIMQAVETANEKTVQIRYPSEQGLHVRIPQLSLLALISNEKRRVAFDDPAGQLKVELEITPVDAEPSPEALNALNVQAAEIGLIDVTADGQMTRDFQREVQICLDRAYSPEHWNEVQLAAWLCKKIQAPFMEHDVKSAFVVTWLNALLQKDQFTLARAIRQKAAIRGVLEQKIADMRKKAVSRAYQLALFSEDTRQRIFVDGSYSFEFHLANYFPASCYDEKKWGKYKFKRHYYRRIGNFDSKEEFECACFLDNEAVKGNLKCWIRNLVKTDNSFSLPKVDGKFYPDFVCPLPDDKILVVEYKGADRWDTPKVKEDRAIGELWAELSDGLCRFVMVKDRDWDKIVVAEQL